MKTRTLTALVAGTLALGASAGALAQYRYLDDYKVRIGRATDWNVSAAEGTCRLRLYIDDKAKVDLRGDQILISTRSGKRSYDQGSVCNQPLPFDRVEDFRVALDSGRGSLFDVIPPHRRNNYTGSLSIDDPQNGGETYELVVAWRNPTVRDVAPLAAGDPYPWYDETRACQDRVRRDFLARNNEDAYLEFTELPLRDDIGANRERIRGAAWARNLTETRPINYECTLNDRTNRVLTSSYEVRQPGRLSALY